MHIDHLRFGIVGMVVGLIVMVVVSLLTAPPSEELQDMIDEIRIPKGEPVADRLNR